MKKLNYTWLIILWMLLLIPLQAQEFNGGSGTVNDPWHVANANQLNNLRNYLGSDHADKYFVQTADIDLGIAPWDTAPGWLPIGSDNPLHRFMAHYDGGGHSISNLFIDRPGASYQGLFGYAQYSSLNNIRIISSYIIAMDNVGALSGATSQSNIFNCRVNAEISGEDNVGGLIGSAAYSSILYSAAICDVTGDENIGGLTGYSNYTSLIYSHSEGFVQGNHNVGGLVGNQYLEVIADCYSHTNAQGSSSVGGLAGYLWNSAISRSFSTGTVSGSSNVGGLLGYNVSSAVYYSFWDVQSSGQSSSAGGSGLNTSELQSRETYHNFNFRLVWTFSMPDMYPGFRDLATYSPLQPVGLDELSGDGTADSPYQIYQGYQLNALREDYLAHYELMNDVDLSDSVVWNRGLGFEAIGDNNPNNYFRGSFNGNGFKISGLTINRPSSDHQALFGYINEANINNLEIEAANVNAKNRSAILVANASGSSVVSSCRVSGELLGQSTLGAVVAYIGNSDVNLCSAYADVRGDERVGGLVGSANYSEISQSFTDGKVRGSLRVGGLLGYLNTGSVYDSYSHSETMGTSNVGGLIGRVYASSSRVIKSYSTGLVQGITDTHGMVGSTTSGNDMYDANYFNTTTSNQSICPAAQGRTSEQMTYPYQYTFSSYDFVSIWAADEDYSNNSGYPYLQGSEPYVPPLPGIQPEIIQLNQTTLRISWEAIPNAVLYKVYHAVLPLAIDSESWLEIGTSADPYYDYVVPAGQSQGFFMVKAGE